VTQSEQTDDPSASFINSVTFNTRYVLVL